MTAHTRITENTLLFINVIITKKDNDINLATLLYQPTQILCINVENPERYWLKSRKCSLQRKIERNLIIYYIKRIMAGGIFKL